MLLDEEEDAKNLPFSQSADNFLNDEVDAEIYLPYDFLDNIWYDEFDHFEDRSDKFKKELHCLILKMMSIIFIIRYIMQ